MCLSKAFYICAFSVSKCFYTSIISCRTGVFHIEFGGWGCVPINPCEFCRLRYSSLCSRINVYKDFVPLSRHRYVESPHPTNSAPIKLYRFRGRLYPPTLRTFSLFTFTYYLERSETTPSVSAHSARFSYRGVNIEKQPPRDQSSGGCGYYFSMLLKISFAVCASAAIWSPSESSESKTLSGRIYLSNFTSTFFP